MHKIGFRNVCENYTIIVLNPSEATDQDSFEIEKVVKKEFSGTKDTLRTLDQTLRKEFQIPNGIHTRLLITFPKNKYGIEILNTQKWCYRRNLEKLGVYPGDIIIIDKQKSDGTWESKLEHPYVNIFPSSGGRPRQI